MVSQTLMNLAGFSMFLFTLEMIRVTSNNVGAKGSEITSLVVFRSYQNYGITEVGSFYYPPPHK